jgi:IclR family acetate operon transcriptional repressor
MVYSRQLVRLRCPTGGEIATTIGTKPERRTRTNRDRALSQTVDRALTVLNLFTPTEHDLALTQIATRLGLHPTTAYRLLSTMEASGYVIRDAASGRYRLGLKLVELAGLTLNQMDLYRHTLPELDVLRDELNLNANLAVLDDGDVFHLAYAVRPDVARFYTAIGRRSVAHCTALGKVLLAAQPRESVHAVVNARGWRPYTEQSIQDFSSLDAALDEVAAHGYAIDDGERRVGTRCVAAPLCDRSGAVVGAISVSGPAEQAEAIGLERVIRDVLAAAERVSSRLGHLGSGWP